MIMYDNNNDNNNNNDNDILEVILKAGSSCVIPIH